jgi:hypothetical protein
LYVRVACGVSRLSSKRRLQAALLAESMTARFNALLPGHNFFAERHIFQGIAATGASQHGTDSAALDSFMDRLFEIHPLPGLPCWALISLVAF